MSLLTASIVKNKKSFDWNLLCLSKKLHRLNLKFFQFQIWTSLKRSEKQLPIKTNFCPFLQIGCTNVSLKLYQRTQSYQNYQTNQIQRSLRQVKNKILFAETTLGKQHQANSVFFCETAPIGKSSISIFQKFYASIEKNLILGGWLSNRL